MLAYEATNARDGVRSGVTQAPEGFDGKGDKGNACCLTGRTVCSKFSLLCHEQSMALCFAAGRMVDCCIVEMTVISSAAGRPLFQQGRKTDVGRGVKEGFAARPKLCCPMPSNYSPHCKLGLGSLVAVTPFYTQSLVFKETRASPQTTS